MKNDFQHKKVIKNQKYENYWKITLAYTDFFNEEKFKRALRIIVEHIDKYNLQDVSMDDAVNEKGRMNSDVLHNDELEDNICKVLGSGGKSKDDSATARKKINTMVKLGFINPYYLGYPEQVKKFIKSHDKKEQTRIFSDIVYTYASFSSSQTDDERDKHEIKFLINTILNRPKGKKFLTHDDIVGLMTIDVTGKEYADEKQIEDSKNWVKYNGFPERKYNQISYLQKILKSLAIFKTSGGKEDFIIALDEDDLVKRDNDNTKRDQYRFSVMKKAVYQESESIYGKKICWLTKKESEGLVVSHLYALNEALRNYEIDEAYDPDNALLLAPGNPDQYIDKNKMSIEDDGTPVLGPEVSESFRDEVMLESYHIDKEILNENRMKYIKIHRDKFYDKYKNN